MQNNVRNEKIYCYYHYKDNSLCFSSILQGSNK